MLFQLSIWSAPKPQSRSTGSVSAPAAEAGFWILEGVRLKRGAGAGWVVPEPFDQGRLNAALREALEGDRLEEWGRHGIEYGRSQDLYSRPEAAADIIESVIEIKAAARR